MKRDISTLNGEMKTWKGRFSKFKEDIMDKVITLIHTIVELKEACMEKVIVNSPIR